MDQVDAMGFVVGVGVVIHFDGCIGDVCPPLVVDDVAKANVKPCLAYGVVVFDIR